MKIFADEIYDHIKCEIISGQYAPGRRIDFAALCKQFNASRLPIRDALNRLNGEQLVRRRPNGGYEVTALTETDIRETYEMRAILEGYIVAQAALSFTPEQIALLEENIRKQEKQKENIEAYAHLNREFHEFFFKATSNSKFTAVLRKNIDYQARFSRLNWMANGIPFINVSFQQHCEIVDAVRLKDSNLAQRMLKLHINTGVEFLIPALKSKGLLSS